jgi:diadenosine tetraphosphate (Ap4A) HIT family hydrolase
MSKKRTPGKQRDRVEGKVVCRVIADYRSAFPDPLIIQPGEELWAGERDPRWSGWVWCRNREGHSGWVPEAYICKKGSTYRASRYYDATELTVKTGERLIVEGQESEWLWCQDERGKRGWVPSENVEIQPEAALSESAFDPECPFCDIPSERIIGANELAYAVRDNFPVTPWHTLIISRRHVPSYFDLTPAETQACHDLLAEMRKNILSKDNNITGFNIGVNQGCAAGQTVMHCHIHLIPRTEGDVRNARGGIRHVIPEKGCYPVDRE